MAAVTQVVIHAYQADKDTGRIELHLKCRTVDGNHTWEGPVKQYSVDPQTLRDRFNNDVKVFEAWAAREHKSLVGIPDEVVSALMKRKGEVIG